MDGSKKIEKNLFFSILCFFSFSLLEDLFFLGNHFASLKLLIAAPIFFLDKKRLWLLLLASFLTSDVFSLYFAPNENIKFSLCNSLFIILSCFSTRFLFSKKGQFQKAFIKVSGFRYYVAFFVLASFFYIFFVYFFRFQEHGNSVFISYFSTGFVFLPVCYYLIDSPRLFLSWKILDVLVLNGVAFLVLTYVPGYDFFKYFFSLMLNAAWILTNRFDRGFVSLSFCTLYLSFSFFFTDFQEIDQFKIILILSSFSVFLHALSISFFHELKQKKTIDDKVKLKTHELAHANERLERSRSMLVQEQLSAKRIFDKIVHFGCLNREEIRYRLSPNSIFNGDVLLAQQKPDGSLIIFLGDFTGHGLPAAMGIVPCSEIFYSMVGKGFSIEQVISEINKKLQDVLPEGVFCAGIMFEVNLWERSIKCWNGGIPEGILFDQKGQIKHQFLSMNIPLGFFSTEDFNPKFDFFPLEYGDRLLFLSDGVLETRNKTGDFFGKERLLSLFNGNTESDLIFDQLTKEILNFQYGYTDEDKDDLTVCELKMCEPVFTLENKAEYLIKRTPELDWRFRLELPQYALKKVEPVPLLLNFLLEYPALLPHKERLFLILSELYANALEHGVLGLDSKIKSEPNGFALFYQEKAKGLAALTGGCVTLDIQLVPISEGGGEVWIKVKDTGKGFEREAAVSSEQNSSSKSSGRGISLLEKLCKVVEYSESGTCVRVCYRW